jgi:hypothetical protein
VIVYHEVSPYFSISFLRSSTWYTNSTLDFSHRVFPKILLTFFLKGFCEMLSYYLFSLQGFLRIIHMTYWSLIKFFRLSLGSPKGSLNIRSYIYLGFLLIFLIGFLRRFASYINILWFFPQGFPNIQDYDWRLYNGAYTRLYESYTRSIDQGGVLGLIRIIN